MAENLIIGADGSGVVQRIEERIYNIDMTDYNVKEDKVANLAADAKSKSVIFYINGLIGLRNSDFELYKTLKSYFEGVSVAIDRAESIDIADRETLLKDLCSKLDLAEENFVFVSKTERINDIITQNLFKFKEFSDVTIGRVVKSDFYEAEKNDEHKCCCHGHDKNLSGENKENQECCCEGLKPLFITIGILSLLALIYYLFFSGSGKKKS
ncbi:MAG: hypothetical protein QMC67_10030 [Candidatus Wallbacteria bacterium]